MLPSRGLPKANPASALRYSLTSRMQPARSSPSLSRHISQARSPSITLSRGALRPLPTRYGAQISRLSSIGAGAGASLGVAPSVFAQRAGASRNLSLWPFGSKKPEAPLPAAESTPTASAAEPPTPVAEPQVPEPPAETSAPVAEPNLADPASTSSAYDVLGDLDQLSVLDIPEQIGYLKALGLDYGFGPTSACQWLLEHVYIYSGMPWWFTIAAIGVLFRVVMFKPALTASKHQILIQKAHTSPEYARAKAAFNEAAFRTRDQATMLQARQAMTAIIKASGAQVWRPFVNFLTVPFSFGMFRIFRGMAAIPVPSLETGGLAWFTDLTVHDPYFILPCASIALTVLMMKQMAATNPQQNPGMANMMKYGLPPLLFLGTAWLPAGLQWFFLIISAGSVVQSTATLNPTIRRWADLPPLPKFNPGISLSIDANTTWQPPTPRRVIEGVKKNVGEASTGLKESFGNTDEKAKWQKAQDYETRRANEEKEKAYRRMDDLRRKRAERAR